MKNKIFTKLLSITLVCVMLVMSMGAYGGEKTAFANENIDSVTEENGVRTAITYDETTEYTVVFDTINDTICYSERSLVNGALKSGNVVSTVLVNEEVYSNRSTTFSQTTKANFKYTITMASSPEWYLQRPRTDGIEGAFYFKTYENSSNSSELNSFKSAVDEMKQLEDDFALSFGVGIINNIVAGLIAGAAVATGGILAPAAISAIVEALAVTATVELKARAVADQFNVCMYAIESVYYATDNMHF